MEDTVLLWVDARLNKSKTSDSDLLKFSGHLHIAQNVSQAIPMINLTNPDIIIFDFDYADITGLKTLRESREKAPFTPLIMLTDQHYENLSIWALRCRVWNYLVKPLDINTFTQNLKNMLTKKNKINNEYMWLQLLPENRIPHEASIIGTTKSTFGTHTAINYMEKHLHEKVSANDVSQQCGLSRYELSRAFKSEYSLTFRDFLLKLRMTRAARMLRCTEASITEISLSVGFNDLSHFTRKFHLIYGDSPGIYRRIKNTEKDSCE